MAGKRIEKKAWFPVPEMGFDLQIRYVPVPEMAAMRERATLTGRDPRSGQITERLDPELYARELATAITDWRGLTREVYERLIPIDPEAYPEVIPCEMAYKVELLEEARGFAAVVLDLCTNLVRFHQERLKADLKN